jgi:hypothetical protein
MVGVGSCRDRFCAAGIGLQHADIHVFSHVLVVSVQLLAGALGPGWLVVRRWDGKEWKRSGGKMRREGQNRSERIRVAATMYVLYTERVESKPYNSEAAHDMTSHKSVPWAYRTIRLHPVAVTISSRCVKN